MARPATAAAVPHLQSGNELAAGVPDIVVLFDQRTHGALFAPQRPPLYFFQEWLLPKLSTVSKPKT